MEEHEPLGTVGGLQLHRKNLNKNDIFLCNCDVLLDADFSEMYIIFIIKKNDLTIIASTKNYEIPYGICQIDKKGKLKKIVEKPTSKLL